jgi:hypothetical protein
MAFPQPKISNFRVGCSLRTVTVNGGHSLTRPPKQPSIMMNSTRLLSIATTRSLRVGALSRAFSSECAPAEKLRSIFEEYRQEQ